MCKLLSIVDIRSPKKALQFASLAIPEMSAHDKDGVGVMRLGAEGLSIQRWLDPASVGQRRLVPEKLARYGRLVHPTYNEEGTFAQVPYAVAVHARYATCQVRLENVHPFVRDGIGLMHNGVIRNSADFERRVSSCDSEALLTRYLNAGVADDLGNLPKALGPIEGHWACIVFNARGYVDIFKDATTSLFVAAVRSVGTVFCTSDRIIREVAEEMDLVPSAIVPIKSFVALRWRPDAEPEIIEMLPEVEPTLPTEEDQQRSLPGFGETETAIRSVFEQETAMAEPFQGTAS